MAEPAAVWVPPKYWMKDCGVIGRIIVAAFLNVNGTAFALRLLLRQWIHQTKILTDGVYAVYVKLRN
jgi:hypothetical protein